MIPLFARTQTLAALSALALILPGVTRGQVIDPVQVYSVTPNPVAMNTAFTLYLNGGSFPCGTQFSRQNVKVNGYFIDLTFEADGPVFIDPLKPDPGAIPPICNIDQADVPSFPMPALITGNYEVWVTQVYACQFSKPACEIKSPIRYAGSLKVNGAVQTPVFHVSPNPVESGKAFTLSALSNSYTCAYTFDSMAATVTGNRINLSFRDHVNPGIKCAASVTDLGPAFKIPALKAGSYVVQIWPMVDCPPNAIDCGIIGNVFYDTLIVKDVKPREGWFLKKKEVLADKAFTMDLLNHAYGNCQTRFSHPTLTVDQNNVRTSFVVETDPNIVCLWDMRPYGPSFEMPAMKTGFYPVYVQTLPACLYTKPACELDIPPYASNPSDTLIVTKTLTTLISALRANGLKADIEGARVGFDLPTGATGTWRAELLTLAGKRLASGAVRSQAGARAGLDLASKPEPGVYLLRLQGAGGETHILPVVRKN